MGDSLKIDLSNYPKRFAKNSREFFVCKKINFVFGKNGTGKTTIADTIRAQFSDIYNVCIFKDFEGVIGENNRLNAVALGTENAEIQVKIEEINKEIDDIKKEVDEPVDKTENFFTKAKKAEESYENQKEKIEKFFFKSAQKIKNQPNPQIAKTSYFKSDFKDEIFNAKPLSDEEVKKYKETIKIDEKKENVRITSLPDINLSVYLKSTNDILETSVSQRQIIEELKNNPQKQNFAQEGMRIHKHKVGEKCAFCGSEIDEKRWRLLGNCFNNEVDELKNRIKQEIDKINFEIKKLNAFKKIDRNNFYDKFAEQIELLNLQIENTKNEYKNFLDKLKIELEKKNKNLFVKSNKLKTSISANFNEIRERYVEIVEANNDFTQNLTNEVEKAKDALRYHEVKKALDIFKYESEKSKLENLETLKKEAEKLLSNKKKELEEKKKYKTQLINQTKNEKQIAIKINKLLKNMGTESFSLQLVDNDNKNQKGQYRIQRWYHKENESDDVVNLSKGEKNIIAFLYFLFSLKENGDNGKSKIIVLDDPMTSNDDTMQYLMISEIQKFYKNLDSDNYFFLLTHNCHFYLNVRPNTAKKYKHGGREISFYEKHGNYCLLSDGRKASIRNIESGKDDFKTNYELLWKEIQFLYEENTATADIMLNPFRKICETYMKFNCIELEKFFENNLGVKKLYDVNQHSADDLEAEQNGKTKREIREILREIFTNNNAKEHFDKHWPRI